MTEWNVRAIFWINEAMLARAARFLVADPFRPEGLDVIVVWDICRIDIGSLGGLGAIRSK
jgi:hypothetical protein